MTEDDLSPWTTWPSLHRGVPGTLHNITDFNQELDEVNENYPSLWNLANIQGISTGVCGSLHSYPVPTSTYGFPFYIPDPFAKSPETHPKEVEAFQSFNLSLSRSSGRNTGGPFPWREAVQAVLSGPQIGIRPGTAIRLGQHLLDEKLNKWTRVRRRTWQSILAFDIFLNQLQKHRPGFSCFFTNHVASTMHRYWAATFPEDYPVFGYSEEWVRTYGGEVHYTMECFDRMLGSLVKFMAANSDYELWIASSMGQAATDAEPARSQVYLTDVDQFMTSIGIEPGMYESRPAMLPRVILSIAEERREAFLKGTRDLSINGEFPVECAELEDGVFRIHPGVAQNLKAPTLHYQGNELSLETMGFENSVIEDETGQNAYHIQEGSLMVFRPDSTGTRQIRDRREISLLDVAPSILHSLGLRPPDYMTGSPILS